MRAAQAVERLAWAVGGAAATVAATQAAHRTPTPLAAIGQALTPILATAAVPAAMIGIVRRRPTLALLSAGSAIGLAVVVRPALSKGSRKTATTAAGESLTIAHANMLFTNHRHARRAVAAVLGTDADVLALSEVTPRHELAFKTLDREGRYPYRFGKPARDSHGMAVWSKLPLDDIVVEPMVRRPGIVCCVRSSWGWVRVVLAHPDPPLKWKWLKFWAPSLRRIDAIGRSDGPPTIVVADLNASRWHPAFRRLLQAGWRDAHEAVGRGLSASWPALGLTPRFIRLDHALVDSSIEVIHVVDFKVPGSDHRGFVVSIAPERCNTVAGRWPMTSRTTTRSRPTPDG